MGCSNLKRKDDLVIGGVEYTSADDVNIMQITVPWKGTLIPQHSHEYDHTTLITNGRALVSHDGNSKEYIAPDMIYIKAGVKHMFETLEDNTILYCIHNISRTGEVEVKEDHQLEIV